MIKSKHPPLNLEETIGFLQQAWDLNKQLNEIPASIRGSVFLAASIMATSEEVISWGKTPHLFADTLPPDLRKVGQEAMVVRKAVDDICLAVEPIGGTIISIQGEWFACFQEKA